MLKPMATAEYSMQVGEWGHEAWIEWWAADHARLLHWLITVIKWLESHLTWC